MEGSSRLSHVLVRGFHIRSSARGGVDDSVNGVGVTEVVAIVTIIVPTKSMEMVTLFQQASTALVEFAGMLYQYDY